MYTALVIALALAVVALFALLSHWRAAAAAAARSKQEQIAKDQLVASLQATIRDLEAAVARLAPYERVADADAEAARILHNARAAADALRGEAEALRTGAVSAAETLRAGAEQQAQQIVTQARSEAETTRDLARGLRANVEREVQEVRAQARAEAEATRSQARTDAHMTATEARREADTLAASASAALSEAQSRAAAVIRAANAKAEEIAGVALKAHERREENERAVRALENIIAGYGDRYIIPAHTLLDDLAEGYSHTDGGQKLKEARDRVRAMVRGGTAAACDYVEPNRRETAIRFVVDAFNGKGDSILALVKHDNVGTLQQQLRDAFVLVNRNGAAFRGARITPQYLDARLEELRWAAVVQELKLQEREEQRRIKEQIREEEKARREYERALRESAKEEEMLRKAMEKAEQQLARASEAQRAQYEEQLAALTSKLQEAETRSQRALSMAQQTRRGHVYVISNVGSFGEHIYKIGLTRRLDPVERIRELGDSSVPFEFDVHALIFAEDAPALEHQLHQHFVMAQVNKVNYRKEFFRVDLAHIRAEIEALGLNAHWTMTAAAREYRETLAIEEAIRDHPAAREAWVKRQLLLEPPEDPFAADESGDGEETSRAGVPSGAAVPSLRSTLQTTSLVVPAGGPDD